MLLSKKDVPLYKRALSFLKPVWLHQQSSAYNPHLEVLLYHDRIQLATRDALYSDGKYYTPAKEVVKYLRDFFPEVREVLLLGVGLGSMVDVLVENRFYPAFTLVEQDDVILNMAVDYLRKWDQLTLHPVTDDAAIFMMQNNAKFDFIFVDIFSSRQVPPFVHTSSFLVQCQRALNPGGKVALNYIITSVSDWEQIRSNFESVFTNVRTISSDINRIFIGSA